MLLLDALQLNSRFKHFVMSPPVVPQVTTTHQCPPVPLFRDLPQANKFFLVKGTTRTSASGITITILLNGDA